MLVMHQQYLHLLVLTLFHNKGENDDFLLKLIMYRIFLCEKLETMEKENYYFRRYSWLLSQMMPNKLILKYL